MPKRVVANHEILSTPRIANAAVRIECWGASSSDDVTRTESRRASDETARRIRCGDFMSSVRLIEMPTKMRPVKAALAPA